MNKFVLVFLIGALLLSTAHAETPPPVPFTAGALPADTLPPWLPHGNALPINHILVLMQENRSFDHYFARLKRRNVDLAPRGAPCRPRGAGRVEPEPRRRHPDRDVPPAQLLRGCRSRPQLERQPPR